MISELLASMKVQEIKREIVEEWRKRVCDIMLTNEHYKNLEFVENLLAIADDAAKAQFKIHEDFSGKICALLELEERKKSEAGKTAIN